MFSTKITLINDFKKPSHDKATQLHFGHYGRHFSVAVSLKHHDRSCWQHCDTNKTKNSFCNSNRNCFTLYWKLNVAYGSIE